MWTQITDPVGLKKVLKIPSFFDFGAVGRGTGDGLWEVIGSLKGKITVILTTHYMKEAATLSDRIGIMKDGSLLAVGTVEELNALAGTNDFETAFVSIVKEGTV